MSYNSAIIALVLYWQKDTKQMKPNWPSLYSQNISQRQGHNFVQYIEGKLI